MTKKNFFLLSVLLLLSFLILSCQPAASGTVLVIRVIDGDTIVLEGGEHLRYIGMDTPETGRPFYEEAKKANEELVLGKNVKLEKDVSERDRYKRLLRYVYVDDTFVNAELVKKGLARAKAYPPDTKYQKQLEALEKEAVTEGRGFWNLRAPVPVGR